MTRINHTFLLILIVMTVLACSLTPIVHVDRVKDDGAVLSVVVTATTTTIPPQATATPRPWRGGGKRQGTP